MALTKKQQNISLLLLLCLSLISSDASLFKKEENPLFYSNNNNQFLIPNNAFDEESLNCLKLFGTIPIRSKFQVRVTGNTTTLTQRELRIFANAFTETYNRLNNLPPELAPASDATTFSATTTTTTCDSDFRTIFKTKVRRVFRIKPSNITESNNINGPRRLIGGNMTAEECQNLIDFLIWLESLGGGCDECPESFRSVAALFPNGNPIIGGGKFPPIKKSTPGGLSNILLRGPSSTTGKTPIPQQLTAPSSCACPERNNIELRTPTFEEFTQALNATIRELVDNGSLRSIQLVQETTPLPRPQLLQFATGTGFNVDDNFFFDDQVQIEPFQCFGKKCCGPDTVFVNGWCRARQSGGGLVDLVDEDSSSSASSIPVSIVELPVP